MPTRPHAVGAIRRAAAGLALAAVLSGCAADATPPPATGPGTSPVVDDGAVLTGPLTVSVGDRAVRLAWEEDEWKFHCLDLRQQLPGHQPVEVSFCPATPAQSTVTIGDEPGVQGVDYTWSATQGFAVGPATWVLRGGDTNGSGKVEVSRGTLQLGPHFNGPCQSKDATAKGLVEWHEQAPVTLDVEVGLNVAARQDVAIATPEIWVEDVAATGNAAPGGKLSFSYTFDTPGMYVVEVNNLGGGAILNCAVYVGAAIPLVPVEVQGGAGLAKAPTPEQLGQMRSKMLGLINLERESVGLAPLVLDDQLNEIAQYHSDNMASQKFFAHTDHLGMGPGERAKKFGFGGPVGENLASSLSVEGAHNGLYWSAAHRSNMLGKTWGRVGVGFAKQLDGKNLLVTQNFSTLP